MQNAKTTTRKASKKAPKAAAPKKSINIEQLHQNAEHGDADAQYHLGLQYAKGHDVPRSEAEAVKWFRCAAAQEHPMAQLALGLCNQDGFGVPQSDVEAVQWYELAAGQGNPMAEGLLYGVLINSFRRTLEGADFLNVPYTVK
jgi:TPR repeat protein